MPAATVDLARLWRMLATVGRFHTVASDRLARTRASMTGTVRVEHADGALHFFERGRNSATGHATHNALRWSLENGVLTLAHLRRGPSTPTRLFSTDGQGAPAAHVCGEDTYAALLSLGPYTIGLRWTARGPGKDAHIDTRYGLVAPPAPAHLSL